jgi:hypothetical protein
MVKRLAVSEGPAKWSVVGYWQKKQAKMSIVGLSVAIWWCWKEPLRNQAAHFKGTSKRRPTSNSRCLVF